MVLILQVHDNCFFNQKIAIPDLQAKPSGAEHPGGLTFLPRNKAIQLCSDAGLEGENYAGRADRRFNTIDIGQFVTIFVDQNQY